jgi:hypothetical protein
MPPETYLDLHYPRGGMDVSRAAMNQPWREGPPRPDGEPTRIYTAALNQNTRGLEPLTSRNRGGSRSGLKPFLESAAVSGWLVQHLATIAGVSSSGVSGSGTLQGSLSGRVVTGIAVCQGKVFWFRPADTPAERAFAEATNNASTTPPLNFTGVVESSANNQKLYMVDGTHYRVYQPIVNTVSDWTATAGAMPTDSSSNAARLITTWRGRTVLSGLLEDAQNWFMSAVSDPTDFDYSPDETTPTQAVAGNNSRLGFIGDIVTALMAYNDDTMFFGGNQSIWMMRGDPMAGGELDAVTHSIGVCWGRAFCSDPRGVIYFMSNTGSIYAMAPGGMPEKLSTPIDRLLQDIDTGAVNVRLEWNERYKGLHVFTTTLEEATQTDTHLFWEMPNNAWHRDVFKNKRHNPLASCVIDGNTPFDRVVLIGGWDGFVRSFDPDAEDDDGYDIESEVWLGPLLTKNFDEVMLKYLQPILATGSGDLNWAVHAGKTAEEALSSTAVLSGKWEAGRNFSDLVRRAGHAIFVRLYSTNRWAIEGVRASLGPNLSKVRRRGVS